MGQSETIIVGAFIFGLVVINAAGQYHSRAFGRHICLDIVQGGDGPFH